MRQVAAASRKKKPRREAGLARDAKSGLEADESRDAVRARHLERVARDRLAEILERIRQIEIGRRADEVAPEDLLLVGNVEDLAANPQLDRPRDQGYLRVADRTKDRFEREVELVGARSARGTARVIEVRIRAADRGQ